MGKLDSRRDCRIQSTESTRDRCCVSGVKGNAMVSVSDFMRLDLQHCVVNVSGANTASRTPQQFSRSGALDS